MQFQSRMEEELRCPRCSLLYVDAVLLSCSHSVCLQCAVHLAKDSSPVFGGKSSTGQPRLDSLTVPGTGPVNVDDASPAVGTSRSDSDRSSVGSETDSGVICTATAGTAGSTTPSASANSRPNSFVGADTGTPSVGNLSTTSSQESGSSTSAAQIVCPRCRRTTGVEDSSLTGITTSLPRNRCLEAVVDRYRESRQIPIFCQQCNNYSDDVEEDPGRVESTSSSTPVGSGRRAATVFCDQCLVFLCDQCVEAGRHGPGCGASKDRAQSVVSPVSTGKTWLAAATRSSAVSCTDHADETLSLYCTECHLAACCLCVDVPNGGRHSSHHTKPLGAMSKTHKVRTSLFWLMQTLTFLGINSPNLRVQSVFIYTAYLYHSGVTVQ